MHGCISQGRGTQGRAIATFSAYNLGSLFRRPCCDHDRDVYRLLTAAVLRTRSLRNDPGVDCALLSALGTPRFPSPSGLYGVAIRSSRVVS